jgi:N-methylhydantoinase A
MVVESGRLLSSGKEVVHQVLFDLRYVGQEFTLPVPISLDQLAASDRDGIRTAFNALHEQRYAHHAKDEPLEIINVRLVALGRRPKLALPALPTSSDIVPRERRPVYFDDHGGAIDCPVYARDALPPGATVPGPALVSEYGSTTVIFPQDSMVVAPTGELLITLGGQQ